MKMQKYSIYILGGVGSGKTCFFAGLSILDEADRSSGIQIACHGEDQAFLNSLAEQIRHGSWPPSTTEFRSIEAYLRFENKDIDVCWIDYPGERFVDYFMGKEDGKNQLVDELRQADFLLIALDPTVDLMGDKAFRAYNSDYQQYKERIDAIQDALLQFRRLRGEEHPLKIAAMITKADLIEEDVTDPKQATAFLQKNAPALYENLCNQFPDMQTFAVSAVGSTNTSDTGEMVPATDLNPWGYQEIFKWIVKEIRARKLKPMWRWLIPLLLAIGILIISGFGYLFYQQKMADKTISGIERRNLSEDNIQLINKNFRKASKNAQQEAINNFLESAQKLLNQDVLGNKEIKGLLNKIRIFISQGDGYRAQELYQVQDQARGILELTEFKTIRSAYEANAEDFTSRALDFLKDYPKSNYKNEVEQLMENWMSNQLSKDRSAVADISVRGSQGLRQKAKAIQDFISKHPEVANSEMRSAAKLALNLAYQIESQKLNLELKTLGELIKENELMLKIFVGSDKDPVFTYKSDAKVLSFEGNSKNIVLDWAPGENIQLEVETDISWNPLASLKIVGYKNISGPLAISALDGSLELQSKNEGNSYFQNGIIFTSDVIGWETKDWELLHDYVAPGNEWFR